MNAISVLNKVRKLQEEIRELNREIKAETEAIKQKEAEAKALADVHNERPNSPERSSEEDNP